MASLSDLELVEAAVRVGGAVASPYFRAQDAAELLKAETKSSAIDLVTAADLAAQAAMAEFISNHRPLDGIRGEEEALRKQGEREWLLDPVDGTFWFVRGLPLWSVVACLRDAEGTVAAAVYDPLADEIFSAQRGRQAIRLGRLLRSAETPDADAFVRVWCCAPVPSEPDFLPALGRLLTGVGAGYFGGSGSQALAWVACGRLHGWVELYPEAEIVKDWDWYPGALLVKAAGGDVREIGRWRIAACTPAFADKLQALIVGS
jgi:fructose-1,6-bisphosphatase/inositol monophosphatase family enzyme